MTFQELFNNLSLDIEDVCASEDEVAELKSLLNSRIFSCGITDRYVDAGVLTTDLELVIW